MAKHLVVCGHGVNDPGGVGNGINERDWTRNPLVLAIQKYAKQLKKNTIEIYDTKKDMFQETQKGWGAYSVSSSFASVTEIHLDASTNTSATGGHVIIHSDFSADKFDLAIAEVDKKYVGWWGSVKNSKGINKRNNLLNLNVFANRGISYRLIELGFITNKSDTDKLKKNYDALAKELVEAITGEKISTVSQVNSNKVTINGKTYWTGGSKFKMLKADKMYDNKELSTKTGSVTAWYFEKGSVIFADAIVKDKNGLPRLVMYTGDKGQNPRYLTLRDDIVERLS